MESALRSENRVSLTKKHKGKSQNGKMRKCKGLPEAMVKNAHYFKRFLNESCESVCTCRKNVLYYILDKITVVQLARGWRNNT